MLNELYTLCKHNHFLWVWQSIVLLHYFKTFYEYSTYIKNRYGDV